MVSKTKIVNDKIPDLKEISGRLVAERIRLKISQTDLRIRSGVGKSTQLNYESGKSCPDAKYLETIDRMGFDVLYIITGARSTEAMSDEHQNLIEAYEAATDDLKRAAFAVLLSPWKKGYLDKPIKEPGYFQHQILGENDARFERPKALDTGSNSNISSAKEPEGEI